jgi:isopenicillin N synthase-like dioxygenase
VVRVIHYPSLEESQQPDATPAAPAAQQPAAAAGPAAGVDPGELPRSMQLSCGEHCDYGLLTLVNQEEGVSALQVRGLLTLVNQEEGVSALQVCCRSTACRCAAARAACALDGRCRSFK